MAHLYNIASQVLIRVSRASPDLLAQLAILVLERPDVFVSIALALLDHVLRGLFWRVVDAIILVYLWFKVSPQVRRKMLTALRKVLPKSLADELLGEGDPRDPKS